MTDVRTEIKAITTELHALEAQFEDWFPGESMSELPSDRPPSVTRQPENRLPTSKMQSKVRSQHEHSESMLPPDLKQSHPVSSASPERTALRRSPSDAAASAVSNAPMPQTNLPSTELPLLQEPQRLEPSPDQSADNFASVLDERLRALELQAQQVNRLAEQQEVALLELKTIAESAQFEAIRSGAMDDPAESKAPEWLNNHQHATVSVVEPDSQGRWLLRNRPVDWFQAERDAIATAEHLRRLQKARSPKAQPVSAKPVTLTAPMAQHSVPRRRRRAQPAPLAVVRDWMQEAQQSFQEQKARLEARSPAVSARLGRLSPLKPEASTEPSSRRHEQLPAGVQFRIFVLWILGAAAVRISLSWLSAVAPSLVPLAIMGLLGVGGLWLYRLLAQ